MNTIRQLVQRKRFFVYQPIITAGPGLLLAMAAGVLGGSSLAVAQEQAAADGVVAQSAPTEPASADAEEPTGGAVNLQTLPETTQSDLAEAVEALNAANPKRAEELARAFLAEHPESIEARLVLAKSLDQFFHRRERVRLYKEAHELAENSGATEQQIAMIVLELGLIYEYLEQFDDAEKYLRLAADNYEMYDRDTNGRVYSALGHLFLKTDREEEGLLALKTAAEKFGSDAARRRLELKETQGYFRESRAASEE